MLINSKEDLINFFHQGAKKEIFIKRLKIKYFKRRKSAKSFSFKNKIKTRIN